MLIAPYACLEDGEWEESSDMSFDEIWRVGLLCIFILVVYVFIRAANDRRLKQCTDMVCRDISNKLFDYHSCMAKVLVRTMEKYFSSKH